MLKTKIANSKLLPLPPSKVNSNVHMCLPWHTRAQCMINCNLAIDHVVYTSEEYAPLLTWCTEHFREAWRCGWMEQLYGGNRKNKIDSKLLSSSLSAATSSSSTVSIEHPPLSKKHSRSPEIEPTNNLHPAKKIATSCPVATLETAVGDDLGEYIKRDTALLEEKGWNKLVIDCRGQGDFS